MLDALFFRKILVMRRGECGQKIAIRDHQQDFSKSWLAKPKLRK